MSDINRVPISYASQPVSNKPKNVNKKTIRIAVKLPQSNEDTCPEYNYKDELDAAKKRGSTENIENGVLDMFDDDDSDVRRIAMQMEEKYGKGVSVSKRKRKGRRDDYIDIGMGYDESDSFIDNTDGYDEIIPQNVTTVYGGFYINCGALEFKTDDKESIDSSSSSSRSGSPSPRNGKRALESNEDSEDESDVQKGKKVKVEHAANGMQNALKKKLFGPNKILKKRRSSNVLKKTVKDLLKEKRKDLDLSVHSSATDLETAVLNEGENNVENGKNISSSITDTIESVVKAADEPNSKGDRLSSQGTEGFKPATLPENLPSNIAEVINKIKQVAVNLTGNDKFTSEVNSLLLSLEKKCKCLGKPSKTKVYEYLSHFMKMDKNVLVQHCNQLTRKEEEKKIKLLLQKLKAEIDQVMPSIISNYEKECELVLEKRTLLQQQCQEGDEKKKSIGRPKRKFQWNDQTRKYLKDTATIKKRSYLQQGHSKESWEEELSTFLKNQVLHLWPEGWMTMTTLTKVCNKLFSDPKTVNQSSAPRKEYKNTASSTPAPSYPSNSALPVSNKISAKTNSSDRIVEVSKTDRTSNSAKEHVHKEKENIHKEQIKEKERTDSSNIDSDKKNNNGNMFFKVDYEKPHSVPYVPKTQELIKEIKESAKLPNVSIIELDSPSSFSNLLPKPKKLKSDFDLPSSSMFKNASSENSRSKERTVIQEVGKLVVNSSSTEDKVHNLSDGDIKKVMEELKNLQKMSSPVKSFDDSSNTGSNTMKKNIDLVTSSFQDEFQKQLYSALAKISPSTSKSNYKCS